MIADSYFVMAVARCSWVSKMNLPTKLVHNPVFAGRFAKLFEGILLHGQKCLIFETHFFPGMSPPSPPL